MLAVENARPTAAARAAAAPCAAAGAAACGTAGAAVADARVGDDAAVRKDRAAAEALYGGAGTWNAREAREAVGGIRTAVALLLAGALRRALVVDAGATAAVGARRAELAGRNRAAIQTDEAPGAAARMLKGVARAAGFWRVVAEALARPTAIGELRLAAVVRGATARAGRSLANVARTEALRRFASAARVARRNLAGLHFVRVAVRLDGDGVTWATAAVAALRAELVLRFAARRRLADVHARVPSGPHESEQHLLSQPAPVQTEPAGAQGALPTTSHRPSVAPAAFCSASAALEIVRADIARLAAERNVLAVFRRVTLVRATIRVGRAGIAFRAARAARDRDALFVPAVSHPTAATLGVRRAGVSNGAVRFALCRRARTADARDRAAVGAIRAFYTRSETSAAADRHSTLATGRAGGLVKQVLEQQSVANPHPWPSAKQT